jgi:hypothetical protein
MAALLCRGKSFLVLPGDGYNKRVTPARRGRPYGEGRPGKAARSGSRLWGAAYNTGDRGGWQLETPSIRLERRDAHVGL